MAVTVKYYNPYFTETESGTHNHASGGDSYKIMLVLSGYTFSKLHDFRDDITNEHGATGTYVAGGITIDNQSVLQNDTNDRAEVNFDDPEWAASTLTARGAVIYKVVGSAATDNLWCNIDFGADFSSSATTFRIELDALGLQSLEAV